jgi:hypothetical protein
MCDEDDRMTLPAMRIGSILPHEAPHGVIAMDKVIYYPGLLGDERRRMPSGVHKPLEIGVGDGVDIDQISVQLAARACLMLKPVVDAGHGAATVFIQAVVRRWPSRSMKKPEPRLSCPATVACGDDLFATTATTAGDTRSKSWIRAVSSRGAVVSGFAHTSVPKTTLRTPSAVIQSSFQSVRSLLSDTTFSSMGSPSRQLDSSQEVAFLSYLHPR